MLGSAVVPCIILLIGRHDIPESPLWLQSKGKFAEARAVMDRVFGEDIEIHEDEQPTKTSLGFLFKAGYFKRIIYLGILTLCQVVPMYAIYTFGPDIMSAFGLSEGRMSILGESAVSLFFLIGHDPSHVLAQFLGQTPASDRIAVLHGCRSRDLGHLP